TPRAPPLPFRVRDFSSRKKRLADLPKRSFCCKAPPLAHHLNNQLLTCSSHSFKPLSLNLSAARAINVRTKATGRTFLTVRAQPTDKTSNRRRDNATARLGGNESLADPQNSVDGRAGPYRGLDRVGHSGR